MQIIFFVLVLLSPASLMAGQDTMLGLWPRGGSPGSVQLRFWQHHLEHAVWHQEFNRFKHPIQGQQPLYALHPDGVVSTVKSLELKLGVGWQVNAEDFLLFQVPYYFSEFSPFDPANKAAAPLDQPDVLRNDSLGDLGLQYRRVLLWRDGPERNSGGGVAVITSLKVPTGRGPWDALASLLATGQGGWQWGAGIAAAWQGGRCSGWLSTLAHVGSNYSQTIPAGSFVWSGGERDEAVVVRPGIHTVVDTGLELVLFKGKKTRHGIGVDLQMVHQSPWRFGDQVVYMTETFALDLSPWLRFRFHPNLDLIAGFIWPLAGNHRTASSCGADGLCGEEIVARVDYRLN